MPQNFLSCDRDQDWLLPPSVRDWLPEDHLAWFVLDTVRELDLTAFYSAYRADGHGRAAHEPAMMVALLVYAYSVGVLSSRKIEVACRQDVAFRVIAGNRVPDHTTIARFRVRQAEALADLFVSALALCARAGMVRVGKIALDGTKMRANAGLSANRELDAIRREVQALFDQAAEQDAAEDELVGDRRGDELPAELANPRSRRARLAQAKRELEAEEQALEAEYQAKLARRREHQQRTGRGAPGRPPKPPAEHSERKGGKAKRNITDPQSRIMTDRGRLIQAFNAQAAVGANRVIIAAEITNHPLDNHQLSRMFAAVRENLLAIGHQERIKVLLADTGYWSKQEIRHVEGASGALVLIPTRSGRERTTTPPKGPEAERIERILANPAGRRLYRKRAELVEPVFAETKHNRKISQFSRRGLRAVGHEWKFIAATHNLLRLFHWAAQPA